ncbi:hypothetical protein [Marinobacter sp. F4216]|uniref:RIFT barrel domain-containing protein n=1 Tax=Marinobacter sp. F4216 TaxID=2874281 RepID=UPI001CBE6DBC|nr:hypothetical protein [Marinobacter sp. F4216]MBZ2167601.1 hypothetical protein [Marinobacter sp. F4216]
MSTLQQIRYVCPLMKNICASVVTLTAVPCELPSLARFGLPCPRSRVFDPSSVHLIRNGEPLECSITPLSTWPDGSLRWMLCEAIVNQTGTIDLCVSDQQGPQAPKGEPSPIELVNAGRSPTNDGESLSWQLFDRLLMHFGIDADGSTTDGQWLVTNTERDSDSRSLWQTTRFECVFQTVTDKEGSSQPLNVTLILGYCHRTHEFELEVRIHNPSAAAHPDGCWDLGDAGSRFVDLFRLSLAPAEPEDTDVQLLCTDIGSAQEGSIDQPLHYPAADGELQLHQMGSGGANWQSPIHWDENKHSTVKANGFTVTRDGLELAQGSRSQPVIRLELNDQIILLEPKDFWQNFPARIRASERGLSFDLFPDRTELCGGESKTWSIRGRIFQKAEAPLATDLGSGEPVVTYNQRHLNECQVLPHLCFSDEKGALTDLIQAGLSGTSNFYEKRERVDEYGWRHFGDLWADHECHGLEPQSYFISHYNNQYDPLMGMTLQYLQHQQPQWLDFVKPLNLHIQDIDIYDTDQDKAEYNGGLFWHTNHYLPAETSGHRSYSKYHTAVYQDFQGGGGPGGQHCYTTGLALQYFLFGDHRAKQKVIQLTEWIRQFYNGNGSLLDRTFRLFTIDIKKNVFTNIGVKAPGYQYPLDRGIGNYLNALIDCYDVTNDQRLLREMGWVIRHTCHPAEDINLRNLDDTETGWFYTVFLQAVARFLFLKESLGGIDPDYWYARQCLLHYGHWMLDNEHYYLDTPEKLEFPNDTWCAQDIRKANLFCFMFYFSETEQPQFLARADEFYCYVKEHLTGSDEAQYTRLLALMMQNDGVQQKFKDKPRSQVAFQTHDFGAPPAYSTTRIMTNYVKDMLRALINLSLTREIRWLKLRLR